MVRIRRLARGWMAIAVLVAGLAGPPAAGAVSAAGTVRAVGNAPADGTAPAPPPGCATTFASTFRTPNVNILDATDGTHPGIVTDTVAISGLGPSVWDVNVTLTISHSRNSDLAIYLISPHGTRVALSTNNGGTFSNGFNNTTFDDQAGLSKLPGPVTLASFTNGVPLGLVMPEQPLARFNGEDPNGTWKLEVRDTAHFQTGVLKNWTLAVTALNEAPGLIQTFGFHSGSTAIPDGGALQVDLFVPTAFAPLSVLTLTTDIQHQRVSDLVINLISPGGISLTVVSNQAGANSNVFNGTAWSDAAAVGPVTDYNATNGLAAPRLAPQEAFAELNGINYTGHWKLRVADTAAGMTGTLNGLELEAGGHTCLPDLSVTPAQTPFYTRLGTTQLLKPFVFDLGAAGHHVALTTNVTGGFAFQSATGAGWSCLGPAAGTLNPNVTCTRASLAPRTTATETQMLTAPLAPVAAPYTLSVSSDKPDLIPIDNTYPQLLTAFAGSANGNPWDVADARTIGWSTKRFTPPDSGGISDGGQNAFSGWGQLRLRVFILLGAVQGEGDITNLGLTYQPGGRWHTTTPQSVAGIAVSRSLYAPPDADWMRFADTFTNNTSGLLGMLVGWGGKLTPTSLIVTSASSSGDQTLTNSDTWAVTVAQVGPGQKALYPPLGYALHSPNDISYLGPYISTLTPITTTVWPSAGNSQLNHVYEIVLPAHTSGTLAYFVVRGLAEAKPGPVECQFYGDCVTPAVGSQVGLVQSQVATLAAHPPLCDLGPAVRATLINWPGIALGCRDMFLPVLRR